MRALAIATSLLLGACASVAPRDSSSPAPVYTPAPVTTPAPPPAPAPAPTATRTYQPGMGIIESATVVALGSYSGAAEGGASGPTMAYRLKMLDGTTQSVVQIGPRFEVGDRVELTKEGRVSRP